MKATALLSASAALFLAAASLAAQATDSATTPPADTSAASVASAAAAEPSASDIAYRVYDTRARSFIDFDVLVDEAARSAVVLFGEQHTDDATHVLQHALLAALAARGVRPVVALEMFERDVQDVLDEFLRGARDEASFLAESRPWPRHAAHYRPLLEIARTNGWPVLAANVPRRIASSVATHGEDALAGLQGPELAWIAGARLCPDDAYRARFVDAMTRHPLRDVTPDELAALAQRYYLAQCLKDETMAESIVGALWQHGGPIVHFAGAFHVEYGDGVTTRVARRAPAAARLLVTAVPVPDLDDVDATAHAARADLIIFTQR